MKKNNGKGKGKGEVMVTITVTIPVSYDFCPGSAAKTTGPPENCYPGSEDEISFDISKDIEAIKNEIEAALDEKRDDIIEDIIRQQAADYEDWQCERADKYYEDRIEKMSVW